MQIHCSPHLNECPIHNLRETQKLKNIKQFFFCPIVQFPLVFLSLFWFGAYDFCFFFRVEPLTSITLDCEHIVNYLKWNTKTQCFEGVVRLSSVVYLSRSRHLTTAVTFVGSNKKQGIPLCLFHCYKNHSRRIFFVALY